MTVAELQRALAKLVSEGHAQETDAVSFDCYERGLADVTRADVRIYKDKAGVVVDRVVVLS